MGHTKNLVALALLLTGLYLLVFGNAWAPTAFDFLATFSFGAWLEHFIAFVPMLFIGMAAALYVSERK